MRANALGWIAAAINRGSGRFDQPGSGRFDQPWSGRFDQPWLCGSAILASSLKINPRRSGVVMTVVVGGFGAN